MLNRLWSKSPINPLAVITTILLMLNAGFLWSQFDHVSETLTQQRKSAEIILHLERLFSAVKDAESGVRGYFITKENVFLDPYLRGRVNISENLSQLRELAVDKPHQLLVLNSIDESLETRIRGLEDVIRDVNRSDRGAQTVSSGRMLMDSLRAQFQVMTQEEEKELQRQLVNVQKVQDNFKVWLIVTSALVILGIASALQKVWLNQKAAEKEAAQKNHQAWLTSQLAELSQAIAGNLTTAQIADVILDKISKLFPVAAANLYLLENEEIRRTGSLASEFGDGNKERIPEKLKMGQGLLGEAISRDGLVEIENIPSNYFWISSSLGHGAPSVLTFLPFSYQGTKVGVMELAGFRTFSADEKELLNSFVPAIALGMNSAQWRERLQKLLEQTQMQSEELQAQQEELRTVNEELEGQAEALQAQQEELRTNNEELEAQARSLELQQASLNQRNQELETARKQVEARARELSKANQYKSEFLAKMSHELRTPLNSLLILSTLLMENKEKNLTSQQKEFSQSIYSAGHDLLGLINDILDLSKIEAQKLAMRPEEFTVRALAEHIQKTFELQAKAKGLEFKLQVDESLNSQKLFTDRQRIEQVLRNFLSNALKFTEAGSIQFEVSRVQNPKGQDQNAWIQMSVLDTGIGIARDKKDLVFEAFEQADSSINRRFGGTGLGLTISRELAGLLGGSIQLESEEGKGSRFSLVIPSRLPRAKVEAGDESHLESQHVEIGSEDSNKEPEEKSHTTSQDLKAQNEAKAALSSVESNERSLLIIEDDVAFRETIANIARDSKFSTVEVSTAEAALEVLKDHTPSAILLDLKLPGMSGIALLNELKQHPTFRAVPVHVISAQDFQSNVLRMGAASFIGKPVQLREVQSALERIENLLSQKMKRLLIIEDNERQLNAITHLVSGEDIEIKTVRRGEEGLELLKEEAFDCVILDLELPDITGFHLLERLNKLEIPLPPVVVYTGRDVTAKEEEHLRKYSESIIIKGARSPERLMDEVNLFLHRVHHASPVASRPISTASVPTVDQTFENKTALLVDDDLRNVFALTSVLESWGFNVRVARDGLEALQTLEENGQVDVVLMDLMMPRMDGLEAMRRIRQMKQFETLPMIALTAKAAKDTHEKCLEAGANDYLPKPIQLGNLRSVLKVWLMPKGIFA